MTTDAAEHRAAASRGMAHPRVSPFGPDTQHVLPKSIPPTEEAVSTSASATPSRTGNIGIAVDGTTNGMGVKLASGEPRNGKGKQRENEDDLEIKLEFGGGLHLLFNKQPRYTVYLPKTIPSSAPASSEPSRLTDMRYLIRWMKDELLSERVEMFGDGEGVRPGILVLVNDTDWELEGELDYVLEDKDEIVFISTLHGG